MSESECSAEEDDLNTEDQLVNSYEDKLKNFRDLLINENISILAKLKRYKSFDFRRKLILVEIKELRKLSELSKIWISVPFVKQSSSRSVISVDSSKAGSNIDVLRLAINDLGWKEYPNGRSNKSCHVVWNSCGFSDNRSNVGAYINKFPGITQCLHKVGFSRILETIRMLFPDHYNFYPLTWYLPHQMAEFSLYCNQQGVENQKDKYYIVKPDAGAQGEGIYLIRKPQEYKMSSKNHVVQEYLVNPLLLDGYKFDLRLYVVLISLDPLKVYICKDGLARFCTHKYCHPTVTNHGNSFMHLTNYSLNKRSNQFVHTQDLHTGSKRTMSSVFAALEYNGYNVSSIWKKLEELVYKTILAIVPQLKVRYITEVLAKNDDFTMKSATIPMEDRPSCFQILGFDVLIMEDLEPLLLEVNSNPSLRLDCEMEMAPGINEYYLSKVDIQIKRPLVKHTLQLLEQEIADKFNIGTKSQDWTQRAQDIFSTTAENTCVSGLDSSDKASIDDSDDENVWDQEHEFGPHFIEIAKRNNTLLNGFQLPRPDSLNDVNNFCHQSTVASNQLLSECDSTRGAKITEMSPLIVKERLQREHDRLAREKNWLNVTDKVENIKKERDESEEESCLNLISSELYKSIYDKLRILEETTVIFFNAMGHRYSENMGATSFRTFGRHCKLHRLGFNGAMIDLIYIDVRRHWSYLANNDAKHGLCYQAFLEAFFRIAFSKFVEQSKRRAVQCLLEHCKACIGPERFNWDKTLYPTSESTTKKKSQTRKDIKAISICKPKEPSPTHRPASVRSSSSGTPNFNTPTVPMLPLRSKYELMKAVQQMYKQKLRISKPTKLHDATTSDSVQSLSSFTTMSSALTKRPYIANRLSFSSASNKTAPNLSSSHKTYQYENPGSDSVKRSSLLRDGKFTKIRSPTKSKLVIPTSTMTPADPDLHKIVSSQRISYSKQRIRESADPMITLNIRNNIKQLSPLNNQRMMKIISIYGGKDLLKTSIDKIQQKYGILKPV